MCKSARKATALLLFCCVILVAVGCSGQFKKYATNDVAANEVTSANAAKDVAIEVNSANYEIIKQKYTDREVKINYPQVTGMRDSEKQKKLNEIIKNDALSLVIGRISQDDIFIEIDYAITKQSNEILSIKFFGYRNSKGAAHPTNEFYTTNINMREGNKLKLKDLINIDDIFIGKVYNGKLIAESPDIPIENIKYDNGRLNRGLQTADVMNNIENKMGIYSYFTKDSLGISTQVSHPYGDHIEWEVKYEDISENIKKGIWKSLFK